MSTVVATGATGHLGRRLVRRLLDGDNRVHVLARSSSDVSGLDRAVIHRQVPSSHLMAEIRPDVALHLAGRYIRSHTASDIDGLIDDNIRFGLHLMEAIASLERPIRLVTASTFFQHFDTDAYRPLNLYAATKQAFEDLAAYYHDCGMVELVTLVLGDVYGEGDTRRKLVNVAVESAMEGRALELASPDTRMNLTHVDDVVAAFLAAAHLPGADGPPRRYSVRSPHDHTVAEVVDIVERVTGSAIDRRWGAFQVGGRTLSIPWQGEPVPGWTAEVELEEGVRRLVEARR